MFGFVDARRTALTSSVGASGVEREAVWRGDVRGALLVTGRAVQHRYSVAVTKKNAGPTWHTHLLAKRSKRTNKHTFERVCRTLGSGGGGTIKPRHVNIVFAG